MPKVRAVFSITSLVVRVKDMSATDSLIRRRSSCVEGAVAVNVDQVEAPY